MFDAVRDVTEERRSLTAARKELDLLDANVKKNATRRADEQEAEERRREDDIAKKIIVECRHRLAQDRKRFLGELAPMADPNSRASFGDIHRTVDDQCRAEGTQLSKARARIPRRLAQDLPDVIVEASADPQWSAIAWGIKCAYGQAAVRELEPSSSSCWRIDKKRDALADMRWVRRFLRPRNDDTPPPHPSVLVYILKHVLRDMLLKEIECLQRQKSIHRDDAAIVEENMMVVSDLVCCAGGLMHFVDGGDPIFCDRNNTAPLEADVEVFTAVIGATGLGDVFNAVDQAPGLADSIGRFPLKRILAAL